MAAFGFSVGDFVTCLQLIHEVAQALSGSKGSASEYRSLFQTLVSLNQSLAASELMYLQWNAGASSPSCRTNGTAMINGMLFERQKCKELMENFLKASQHYTDAFVKERGKAVVRNWRKFTWLFQKDEVIKLEKELQRHLQALRIYTDALFQSQTTANAEMMESQVGSILSDVSILRTDVSIVVKALQAWDSPRTKGLGYPWEVSASLSDNVLLLDATGRSILLPMIFLSSPAVLHDLLNIMYRDIPGHRKILRREYNITDEEADGTLIKESNWNDVIRPGMQISLNILLKASSSWNMHRCPRCTEAVLGHSLTGKRRRCQKCQLTFRVFDSERVIEENEATGVSSSSHDTETNTASGTACGRSGEPKPHTKRKEKSNFVDDHFFQRIHYQRDIKKSTLVKPVASGHQEDSQKFEINELPPLHQASARGDLPEILSLLDRGVDIDAPLSFQAVMSGRVYGNFYFEGCTPLQLASFFGKANAIKVLLDRGASLVARDADRGDALAYSILGEDPGVAIGLLARGADVHASSIWGQTALHLASGENVPWLTRLLLQYGADVNIKDEDENTPLHDAARLGHEAVLNIMLETSPDISIQNNTGCDLFNLACICGQEVTANILLDYGADISTRDRDRNTPLHNACLVGNEAIVKTLLEHNAAITSRNNVGDTPLHDASWNGSEAVVRLLLEHGADVTSRSDAGGTPLHYASLNGNEAVVKLLLEQGADVTSRNNVGDTPLHDASWNGSEAVVKLLLEHGADVTSRSDAGGTPLHYASLNGNEAVVKLLLEQGADFKS